MSAIIKLVLIGAVWLVVAQTKSMLIWCFIGAPLVYLIWRLELSRSDG